MNFLRIFFVALFIALNLVLIESADRSSPTTKRAGKKIKHERIQPAGGFIGFIKPKYHKN